MNILERLWFKAKTGADIRESNNGNPVEQVVIRFRNYYIEVLLDDETGEPCDFGWSPDPLMFHVPVREHYTARQEWSDATTQQPSNKATEPGVSNE